MKDFLQKRLTPSPDEEVTKWLLDSDPSICWQVMHDISKEPEEKIKDERSRIAAEGWGFHLIFSQSSEGLWWPDLDPWPLKNTLFTLVMLKDFGLDPACKEAKQIIGRIRDNVTWLYHNNSPFFDGETEPCINGRVLAVGAYFGENQSRLVDRLLSEQLVDGGWNCEAPPSKHSSFHSTICVLEGLLEYEKLHGADSVVTEARIRGQEYLMDRSMFRSRSTGKVIDSSWTLFSYPPTYHYDILRGLDYLRSSNTTPDDRILEAIELMAMKQQQNGRWILENPHKDRISFELEQEGSSSRWNTLRAMRVLDYFGKFI